MPLLPTILSTHFHAVAPLKAHGLGYGLGSGIGAAFGTSCVSDVGCGTDRFIPGPSAPGRGATSHSDHHLATSDFIFSEGRKSRSPNVRAASFLSSANDVSVTCSLNHDQYSDFLFGSVSKQSSFGGAGTKAKLASVVNAQPNWPLKARSARSFPLSFKPTLSAASAAGIAAAVGQYFSKVDPLGDGEPEEDATGWVKIVPRGLRIFLAADIFSALLIFFSSFADCDVPLRSWLVVGILMGFPYSWLINKIAHQRPMFKYMKMTVTRIRNDQDPSTFEVEGLVLYDEFERRLERPLAVEEYKDGNGWRADLYEDPIMVSGYQVITHTSRNPGLDPVAWTLEASLDGETWTVIDQVDDADLVPRTRGKCTEVFDDLEHLNESIGSFRAAFLAEVLGCTFSLVWLCFGTMWLNMGTEQCIDETPYLWTSCFLMVIGTWSFVGTFIIGIIISAAVSVLMGSK